MAEGFEAINYEQTVGQISERMVSDIPDYTIVTPLHKQVAEHCEVEDIEESEDLPISALSNDFHRPGSLRSQYNPHNSMRIEVDESIDDYVAPERGPKRRRSILKNYTPQIPDAISQACHTEANTRRNSTVFTEGSGYFTSAVDALEHADLATHQIVPRRKSRLYDDVEIFGSEGIVPETSPQPRTDYVNGGAAKRTAVLRKAEDDVYFSQA